MNKKTIGSLFIAVMAALTVGIFSNSTDVSASGVATTFDHITRMYNKDGDLITNRALGANTPWQVGIFAEINGEKMYQVSTNEFVKASETSYEGQTINNEIEAMNLVKSQNPSMSDDHSDYYFSYNYGMWDSSKGKAYYVTYVRDVLPGLPAGWTNWTVYPDGTVLDGKPSEN
ncbi:SLAP domain-containing protein [Companilactobacillus keshanensis]|uniref:SLAP domain-containing protein n=1 Tax=Companilactobacillus keshanensis TaxID=2486003 RepID=A0ABW4BWC9_9LACO|nr:SLAP domain-containing protein [Companilactobacillus keshanensis]